jgi:hypothetical protein
MRLVLIILALVLSTPALATETPCYAALADQAKAEAIARAIEKQTNPNVVRAMRHAIEQALWEVAIDTEQCAEGR